MSQHWNEMTELGLPSVFLLGTWNGEANQGLLENYILRTYNNFMLGNTYLASQFTEIGKWAWRQQVVQAKAPMQDDN